MAMMDTVVFSERTAWSALAVIQLQLIELELQLFVAQLGQFGIVCGVVFAATSVFLQLL